MTQSTASSYKSPLHEMTQSTPTCLWNDSASVQRTGVFDRTWRGGRDLQSGDRAGCFEERDHRWKVRIQCLIKEFPTATEDEIAWQLVREISMKAAALLKPIFDEQRGKNGTAFHSD